MKKTLTKKRIIFGSLLLFIITWGILLYFYKPSGIVNLMGVRNGYILIFIIAIFGGVSSFTSASFFTTLITLAIGGLNPFFLGIVGGIGVTVGDSLFFYFGYNGRSLIPKRVLKKIDRFSRWISTRHNWFVPVVAFVYAGLTPLPNDILMVSLAVANIKYKRIVIPVLLGNMFLVTVVAFLAVKGGAIF